MKKTKTAREWALYRAGLDCSVGRDALEGKGDHLHQTVVGRNSFALLCALSAIQNIAEAMALPESTTKAGHAAKRRRK